MQARRPVKPCISAPRAAAAAGPPQGCALPVIDGYAFLAWAARTLEEALQRRRLLECLSTALRAFLPAWQNGYAFLAQAACTLEEGKEIQEPIQKRKEGSLLSPKPITQYRFEISSMNN